VALRIFVALALAAYAAVAQALPDAQTLFERAQAAAKSFHSFQFMAETTTESGLPIGPIKSEISIAYLNPGKTRMEIKTAGLTILDVSDGETIWVFNSVVNHYAKVSAAQGPAAVVAAMGVKLPDVFSVNSSYKTTGEETIEIDGQKHDCWIVEVRIGELTVPSQNDKAPASKMTGGVMTSWIDKKLGVDLQSTLTIKMLMGGRDIEMRQKIVKRNIQIDQPMDEALFTFTPPPGAKEVKELNFSGSVAVKPDLAGKPAPAFEVKSVGGETFSQAALKGKPVLLDFWATWCAPCRRSMPVLEKIALEQKDSDLVILGVNTGEDPDVVDRFLKKTPFGYPAVLSGESGILESYQVTAYPTFILIGRDGKIMANEIGFSDESQLRQLIDKAGLAPKKQ
jgi:thiol-disulfide isomerase/thioredoxin/outer membrane lipoprotein-sorting protein